MMKKILVLDDNREILQVVTEVLSYENFEVKAISTSVELLDVAKMFRPDLILLDLLLADGHGGELCRSVKNDDGLGNIPVIIFTAYQQPGQDFSAYGCDAVLNKPFDIDELLDKVNALTAQGAHSFFKTA